MKHIATKTSYLEMRSPFQGSVEAPRDDVHVQRSANPSVESYRHWYRSVGKDFQWVDRLLLPDAELRQVIHDERVEIYLLQVASQTAGYSELDRRQDGEIELAYFGLYPPFIGQGLGKYFLAWTLARAWSYRPQRVWVHTCDLDHQAALPTYLKAGFKIYDEKMIDQVVFDDV